MLFSFGGLLGIAIWDGRCATGCDVFCSLENSLKIISLFSLDCYSIILFFQRNYSGCLFGCFILTLSSLIAPLGCRPSVHYRVHHKFPLACEIPANALFCSPRVSSCQEKAFNFNSIRWDSIYVNRMYSDPLVWSSLCYGVGGMITLTIASGEVHLAAMQFGACLTSCCYHKSREAAWSFADVSVAFALFFVCVWALYVAYIQEKWVYFFIFSFGLPLTVFLGVVSGDPATVHSNKSRKPRPIYELVHLIWHFTTWLGPPLAGHFFSAHSKDSGLVLGAAYLDPFRILPVIPVSALMIGLVLAVTGNKLAMLPFH